MTYNPLTLLISSVQSPEIVTSWIVLDVCFASTEECQTEPQENRTIDDVLGDHDTDELVNTTAAADEEAELLEQRFSLGTQSQEKTR